MAIPSLPTRRSWRTYSFRITLLYFALLGATVLFLFAAIFWVTAEFMEDQLHAEIEAEASLLVDTFNSSGAETVVKAINRRAGPPGHTADYYLVQDAGGKRIAGNLEPGAAPLPGWYQLPIPAQLDPGEVNSGEESDTLLAKGQVLPNGWFLLVGRDTDRYTDFEDEIVDIAGWSLAGVFVLVLVGGRAISASMLRRLKTITDASSEIMHGNLGRRIALRGTGDEFDQLSGNLNEMLDRIQALMEDLRQVSNDIAHDLRTPLTRLRQRLEGARDKAHSAEEYRVAVENAIGETDEILVTFGALLRIAQIESGAKRAAFSKVDLSAVAQSLFETYAAVAEDRRQSMSASITPGITVSGDPQLLTQMLANLVENALRHTPPETRIELDLAAARLGSVFRILDNGPGIAEAERRKVFRRFYRLDASRSTPGSGLGLSLVAAIAELHWVAIELEDAAPGLVVVLRFPA
jgi:signal transduction histidine kinase